MEYRLKQIGLLFILMVFVLACDRFEMRGFIISYESANERFEQSMEWNASHPYKEIKLPTDDYHFFVLGDAHIGGTKNFDFFINNAIKTKATAAIMNGDITNGHAEDYLTLKEHLPVKDSLITFQIAGNHDLYFDGWKTFHSLFGTSTFSFTVTTPTASDFFICLDTAGGTLGSKQLEWLKDILEKQRPGFRRCIIFTHNNLFRHRHATSANLQLEELYVFLDWCVKYDIDMVICGHDHEKNVSRLGKTTFLTTDALEDGYKNAGYLKLFVKQGIIEYEFVNLY